MTKLEAAARRVVDSAEAAGFVALDRNTHESKVSRAVKALAAALDEGGDANCPTKTAGATSSVGVGGEAAADADTLLELRARLARCEEALRGLIEDYEESDPYPTSDRHPLYVARAYFEDEK